VSGPIAVYGAGGHGREVAALINALNVAGAEWTLVGYLSDDTESWGSVVGGLPVLGGGGWLEAHPNTAIAMGIGAPAPRRRVVRRIDQLRVAFPTLIHPTAIVQERVSLGRGVVFGPGAVATVDIEIGEFSVVNVLASISHDSRLGAYATIAPRVTLPGNTLLGDGCDLGVGVSLVPGVQIGEWSVVGAGAVVTGDLPPNCTAVGVPARVIKSRPPNWADPLA
jgi:sugar O-acyltransferase (sialic acid O-acetyltransferase NeuD family)